VHPSEYFVNNRVILFHFGGEGKLKNLNYLVKASWSKNYGTYYTTDEEQSTNISDPGENGIFGEQEQFSSFVELNRNFTNGVIIGLVGAFDIGDLYYDSFGLFFKFSYSFAL
jgi:hypothetical protein